MIKVVGLMAGELSIGAHMCVTAFQFHVTSGKPLWEPRVVLGLVSKSELLENRRRPSEDS